MMRHSVRFSTAMMTLCLCTIAQRGQGQIVALRAGQQPTVQTSSRSLAALDLAVEAADKGFLDVSMEAVRRAVGSGPPVSNVNLGGLLGGQSAAQSGGFGMGGGGYGAAQSNNTDQTTIAEKLQEVDKAWQDADLDAKACYELWCELVFPEARPNEGFAYSAGKTNSSYSYSVSFEEKRPDEVPNGAASLVKWARKADQVEDLRKLMDERGKMPGAVSTVQLLELILAGESKEDLQKAEKIAKRLASRPAAIVGGPDSVLMASLTGKLLDRLPKDSPAGNALWNGLKSQIENTQRWSSNSWLKYWIAKRTKDAAQSGDIAVFDESAELLLTIYDPIRSGNEDYVAQASARFYGAAANAAFEAEQLVLGLRCIRQQTQFSSKTTRTSGDKGKGLLNVKSGLFKKLLATPRQERFDMLFDLPWDMRMLGLNEVATVTPYERIPQEFVDGYKKHHNTDKLPLEQVTDPDRQCLSLIEWVMRDAIALGKTDAIKSKIAQLEERGSDDADIAKLMLQKAQDQPLDLSLVSTKNDEGEIVLRRTVKPTRGELPAIDYEIALAALEQPEYRAAGAEFAERLAARGLASYTNDVKFARFVNAEAKIATKDITPPSALKHFIVTEEFSSNALLTEAIGPARWIKNDDGVWTHHSSIAFSSLLLKYPIQGDYTIEFECEDGTYKESGVTFAGLHVDFRGYMQDVALDTISRRRSDTVKTTAVARGEANRVRIERTSDEGTTSTGTYSLTINDEHVADFELADGEFPFVGPHSMHHREMGLRDFRITGDVEIPRQLNLLSDRLLGWSGYFRTRALPPLENYIARAEPGKASVDEPQEKEEKSVVVNYDWTFEDGVLESVDHARLAEIDKENGLDTKKRWHPPHEQWIYYSRPLLDGEQMTFEFYHESGAYSVRPTLGRVAVLLDEKKIFKHWITSDNELFGISTTYRVPASTDEVLGEVTLKEKAWNTGKLSRDGDQVVFTINERDVLKLPVSEMFNGRFGFLNSPEQFQLKVRNVVLSGDWPTQLPADLFEEVATK